jgi:hypothetical protein
MNADINKLLAIVTIVGFAIQQAIQLFDVAIAKYIIKLKTSADGTSVPLPGGLSDADYKKVVTGRISLFLGLITVLCTGIRTLQSVGLGGKLWHLYT